MVPFICFIYLFCHTKYTKKESLKNALQNKSGEESLNRNHRAYNIRLPQLQLMMATHSEKSGKNIEFWIQKSVQTLKREIELQMSLSNPSFFHISCVECSIP